MSVLEYRVTLADVAAHRFMVTLHMDVQAGMPLRLFLPGWIPGSYLMRDFARHLLSITADSDGQPITIDAIDRQSWQCVPSSGSVVVRCEFYARDASVRAAFLDDTRGFLNFTSLALRPEGKELQACRVQIEPPADRDDWRLITTMPAEQVDERGFGHFMARDYWDLIDHPVAMGAAIERVDYSVRDVPHAFVLLGHHDADTRRLATDLAAICEAQAAVFDALPVREYLFFAQITPRGFGGLEHRESSVLQVARDALPSAASRGKPDERGESYETLLGLCSHEYFHLWNVKRIRPAAVAASDLTTEAYFRDLWAYEGVTSYYDDLGLVRAGMITEKGYLGRLAKLATRIDRTPGRHRQSLVQSSFDAWLKFYRPDENTPNAVVSYYGKGAQFALALDLKLRVESGGAVSLDDAMRRAWTDYGSRDQPVPEHGLLRIAEQVSGLDLAAFAARYLHTTADAPWNEWLAHFGIKATQSLANDQAAILLGRLGLRLASDCPPKVLYVLDDTPAQAAGVSPGDRLLACDGLEVGADFATRLGRYPGGACLTMHLFREDELLVRSITLAAHAANEWHLDIDEAADQGAHRRRACWLGHDYRPT